MPHDPRSRGRSLPLSHQEQIDAICDRFETAWKTGDRPKIEDQLGDWPEPERSSLLRELLHSDVHHRRILGETPSCEEYRERFPNDHTIVDEALDVGDESSQGYSQASTVAEGDHGGIDRTRGEVMSGAQHSSGEPLPIDHDPALTYSLRRADGSLRSPVSHAGRQQLATAFREGVLLDGRYHLQTELGHGGMGVVYLGHDSRLGRSVAVKGILPPRGPQSDDQMQRAKSMFEDEARLGARLLHPAIATIFDYGFHEGMPYSVFEYVPGDTLRDVLRRRGRLPLEEVRLILPMLAQALDYAHSFHIVHRDLKPENIRVTGQGQYKILDLGLAKRFNMDQDWRFAGTPAYASPEQAAEQPSDGRTDQYALAAIVYEMLGGVRPFADRRGLDVLKAHREQTPAPVPGVPDEVYCVLLKALAKNPSERFSSCSGFAIALGCLILRSDSPDPEILRETSVEGMFRGWLSRKGSHYSWFGNPVQLALTREAIWSCYRNEVERWPLRELMDIQPQVDPESITQAKETKEAEAMRRLCIGEERLLKFLGLLLYTVGAVIVAVTVFYLLTVGQSQFTSAGHREISARYVGAVTLFFTLGTGVIATGWGIRRFHRWAGIAAVVQLSLPLLSVLGLIYRLFDDSFWVIVLPVVLSPFLALPTYLLAKLLSSRGRMVFTPEYQNVMARTPHMNPRRSVELAAGWRRTLRLTFRDGDGHVRQSFCFPGVAECRLWAGLLQSTRQQANPESGLTGPVPEKRQVVLLAQDIAARYQVLGRVEAKDEKLNTAKARLQIRSAVLGADAVVSVQKETLPEFGRTLRLVNGVAIRAVDERGRQEFRSRWFASRITSVANWGMSFSLLTSLAIRPTITLLWPLMVSLLLRRCRWPQFVRPFAATMAAVGLQALFAPTGICTAAAAVSYFVSREPVPKTAELTALAVVTLLDPVSLTVRLAVLFFGLFLARTALSCYNEHRQLTGGAGYEVPTFRRCAEVMVTFVTALFLLFLVVLFCLSVYSLSVGNRA